MGEPSGFGFGLWQRETGSSDAVPVQGVLSTGRGAPRADKPFGPSEQHQKVLGGEPWDIYLGDKFKFCPLSIFLGKAEGFGEQEILLTATGI